MLLPIRCLKGAYFINLFVILKNHLLKQQEIEIELFPVKKDMNSNIKELYQELINIKKRITDNEELTKLKKEINELKNDNKLLISIIENQNNDIKILKDSLFNLMNK